MTTIDSRYINFLRAYSDKHHITQRTIIEKALDLYMKQQKEEYLDNQYSKMAKDVEYTNELSQNAENYLSYL